MLRALTRRSVAAASGIPALLLFLGRTTRAQGTADMDAYTVMLSDPRFRTWCSLVGAAGLAPYARGGPPYTVFATTEQGFDRYPFLRLDLLPTASSTFPDTARITRFVRAHVILGKHAPGSLSGTQNSLAGTPITLSEAPGGALRVTWQSDAGKQGTAVTGVPITAVNAVIYPIDDVLLT